MITNVTKLLGPNKFTIMHATYQSFSELTELMRITHHMKCANTYKPHLRYSTISQCAPNCCFLTKINRKFQKHQIVVDPEVLCRNNFSKMELDEDSEPTLADFIDKRLAGMTKKKPLRLNGTTFIAAYLQLIIKSRDFKQVHQSFQERLRHLSFLVHLLCRYDDFDSIFQEYKIVQV